MANLQINGIDNKFYSQIKELAASENRSISQQILYLIKEYLAKQKSIKKTKTPVQVLLELSGSWIDSKDPEDIFKDIKKSRANSKKLSKGLKLENWTKSLKGAYSLLSKMKVSGEEDGHGH
jgi:hypothetical protein